MGAKRLLPAAIVWGLGSQIGVSIVRELGRAGVPVLGLAEEARDVGARSRYLCHLEIARPRGVGLVEQIRRLGEEHGARVIFAVSEGNCLFLARHRESLGSVKPLVADERALALVYDKSRTLAIAERIGIRVPRSMQPTRVEDIDKVAEAMTGTNVLKWSDANSIIGGLNAAGIAFNKVQYTDSAEALRSALHTYDALKAWPLVQEYCPGAGLGQFFFMHRGRALRRFQHMRVAEWPPEGGFSSVCDALALGEHRDLQEKSITLLREIGWDGVAMVEYRYDPVTRLASLMEINGRYWGSYPLAVHSGAGFSLYAYFVAGLGEEFDLPAPRSDLRCRMVATEIKRLHRIFFEEGRIQDKRFVRRPLAELARFVFDFMRPNVRYYLYCRDDMGPLWQDMRNVFAGSQ